MITYQPTEFIPPDHAKLVAKALDFARTMKKTKDKSHLERKANAAERYAENLIGGGVEAEAAWNRAIRLEILESESD